MIVAISDGAGSACLSHLGSTEAIRYLLELIPRSNLNLAEISKENVKEWLQKVLEHLQSVAEREKSPLSEFACTLLFGIVAENQSIFCQIGDGGWVVVKNDELLAVTWPQMGQFANITTFLTTAGALDAMQFEKIDGKLSALAGFSDGLQTLALNFTNRSAHGPFFLPMFDSIKNCDDETSLIAPLQSFLASEPVAARTEDDKTLVLAFQCEAESH